MERNLTVNMVIRNDKKNTDFRILYISNDNVVCIELNKVKSLPYYDSKTNIEAQLDNNELVILKNDPYYKIFDERAINPKFLNMRDNAYKYVKNLCAPESLFYLGDKYKRGKLINEVMKEYKVTKKTIYKNMVKFLQGGMTINSLLSYPKFNRTYNYKIKTGRKRDVTEGVGIIVDAAILEQIQDVYTNYFKKFRGTTIIGSYRECLNRYYSYLTYENGKEVKKVLDDDKILTYSQFRYHFEKIRNKEGNLKEEIVERFGRNKLDKDERPNFSREDIDVIGPGQVYEVDSTPLDVYLVSNLSRNIGIGKATLYITIDVYSRLITGYYVGPEQSSWIAAMMVYLNMCEDKVEYCKKYGINITVEMWPSFGTPAQITADRGETISKSSDYLARQLGITMENTPPRRPDLKGIVENWFGQINEFLQSNVPGGIKKDHMQRCGHNYSEDAVLNTTELNKIIILRILEHNSKILKKYKMSNSMISNGIIPTPKNIWSYGADCQLLFTKSVPIDKVMLALLPKSKATIGNGGLNFHDKFYLPEGGFNIDVFLRSSKSKGKKIDIAFDPRNLNKIYTYDQKTMQCQTCNMLKKSSKNYLDLSYYDILKIQKEESKLKHKNNSEDNSLHINSLNEINSILSNAKKQSKLEAYLAPSPKSKTKNIKNNRKDEADMLRKEQFFDLDSAKKNNLDMPDVNVDIPSSENNGIAYEKQLQKNKDKNNTFLKSLINKTNNKSKEN